MSDETEAVRLVRKMEQDFADLANFSAPTQEKLEKLRQARATSKAILDHLADDRPATARDLRQAALALQCVLEAKMTSQLAMLLDLIAGQNQGAESR